MPLLLAAPGQPDVTKMRWQMKIQLRVAFIAIAYLIFASESKELSQGFLKEWIKTEK